MADRNFLAFDLGAESGRAVLGRLSNGRLALEEKHRFPNPNGRMNGHLQWNLLGQWEELKTGLRKTVAAATLNCTAWAWTLGAWILDWSPRMAKSLETPTTTAIPALPA